MNNRKCGKDMSFKECELLFLHDSVEYIEKETGKEFIETEDINNIMNILEFFIIKKKLICYGGTAINNILPKEYQFYNREVDVPDYDVFSKNALEDVKELADIFYLEGYEVEAKSGVHYGTFKIFVNFIPIIDITNLDPIIFDNLYKDIDSITISGIKYSSPNYLRMGIYLELSRPLGEVDRWEKVYKRLLLLNKSYPLKECNPFDFSTSIHQSPENESMIVPENNDLFYTVRDSFFEQEVVFFGSFAISVFNKKIGNKKIERYPEFDVLAEDIQRCSLVLRERLAERGFKKISEIWHKKIGEIIPTHIEIRVSNIPVAFIYEPISCHNYNVVKIGNTDVRIATIDTILSFYFAFIYSNMKKNKERLLCMASFLFHSQEKNKKIEGIFKRFSLKCIGKQRSMEEIRALKHKMHKELIPGTLEYYMWFLKYNPENKFKKGSKRSAAHDLYIDYKTKTMTFHKGNQTTQFSNEYPKPYVDRIFSIQDNVSTEKTYSYPYTSNRQKKTNKKRKRKAKRKTKTRKVLGFLY